jgi:hydroxypyruvate reductase
MALAFLIEFLGEQGEGTAGRIGFLAASTDGADGPTDAAGALVLPGRDRADPAEARRHLEDNDSYGFFKARGGLFTTGPTSTNVCDLHLLIVR